MPLFDPPISVGKSDPVNFPVGETNFPYDLPPGPAEPVDPMDRYIGMQEQSQRRMEELGQRQQAEAAPVYSALQQEAGQSLPQHPQMQPLPQWKPQPLIDHNKFKEFFGPAMIMALVGAATTRRPMMTALNSLTGAMKGYHEGSIRDANKKLQDFHEQFNGVMQQNNQVLQEYNMTMNDRRMNLEQKMTQLRILAAKHNDEYKYQLASQRNAAGLYKAIRDQEKMSQKVQMAASGVKGPNAQKEYEWMVYHPQYGMLAQGKTPPTPQEFMRDYHKGMLGSFQATQPGLPGVAGTDEKGGKVFEFAAEELGG